MKIGIDGLLLRGRDAGSLRYFELLLESLAYGEENRCSKGSQEHRYIVFANRRVLQSAALPRSACFSYQETAYSHFFPSALRQQLYTQWHAQGKLDLLHTPVFAPPLRYPGKTVMTLFDLTFLLHPQTQKWTGRLWWNLLGVRGFKKAERIITISNSTRRDLCQYMDIPEEKVDVIYPFVSPQFHALPNNTSLTQRRAIANKYHLPEKYILFVSTLERRKNIASLLQAFAQARRTGSLAHSLVLVGQPGWLYQDMYRIMETLGIRQQVILLGYVPEADLPGLYHAADLFAFLSDYEGFGFPVLEAMACGVPVLTSNVSSLPEVVGKAGVMVAPHDVEQAAAQMVRLLTDSNLRSELIQDGLEQAGKFSRQRFRQQILSVYQDVLSSADGGRQPAVAGGTASIAQMPGTSPILSYTVPPGIQEPKGLGYPVLSTPQNGLVLLDRPMLALWRQAGQQSIPEILAWAQDQWVSPLGVGCKRRSVPPEHILAALACLAEAGLLTRLPQPPPVAVPPGNPTAALRSAASVNNADVSVSAILVAFNSLPWLEACLASLAVQTHPPDEIIIIDNASTDGVVDWLKQAAASRPWPETRLIQVDCGAGRRQVKPLSHALNLGLQAARGDYHLLLNPDLTLAPDAIEQLLAAAQTDPNCAAVAAKLRFLWAPAFLNGLGNHVGAFTWGSDSALGHLDLGQFDHWELLPSACFAAALIPAKALARVGPLDEGFPMYYEDSEWCYRARLLGCSILAAPRALVYHALGSRIPAIAETGLSPAKLHHVVLGRLRFSAKIAGPGLLPRLLASYLLDDLAQFSGALLRRKWQNAQAYPLAWKDFLASLPALQPQRKSLQAQRSISDKALFSLQKKAPIPLVWHGIPQFTWDIVQNFYLPLLAARRTRPIPEFPSPVPPEATHPLPQPSLLQRAWQITLAEGAAALFHRFGRYIQSYLSRL